jgi:hypothetical protein
MIELGQFRVSKTHAVTKNFQNASELQTQVMEAVRAYTVWVGRQVQTERRLAARSVRVKVSV